jgi:acyl-CoA thioesterase I
MHEIACIGDSITEGADIDKGFRWTTLVGNALKLGVHNCGIGGDTTQGMLSRFYPEVLSIKPYYVIIMGGTNDLWWDLDIRTILSNLFSIVCQARYHDITPIIGIPLPIDLCAAQKQDYAPPLKGYKQFNEKLKYLVNILADMAASNEVPIVHGHRVFCSEGGEIFQDLYLPDGLHPNRHGHRKLALQVIEMMRQEFHL